MAELGNVTPEKETDERRGAGVGHGESARGRREWQAGYLKDQGKVNSLFRPCPMRDHHAFARQTVKEFDARPMDEEAARAIADPDYHRRMVEYNEEVGRLLDPLWQQEIYCRGCEEEGAEAVASG